MITYPHLFFAGDLGHGIEFICQLLPSVNGLTIHIRTNQELIANDLIEFDRFLQFISLQCVQTGMCAVALQAIVIQQCT